MEKILIVNKCRQCRYGEDRIDTNDGWHDPWCHEEEREIDDIDLIPEWCPLEDKD